MTREEFKKALVASGFSNLEDTWYDYIMDDGDCIRVVDMFENDSFTFQYVAIILGKYPEDDEEQVTSRGLRLMDAESEVYFKYTDYEDPRLEALKYMEISV